MKLRSDLPIKYYIGIHRHVESYPEKIDVLFDISSYIFAQRKRKTNWNASDMFIEFNKVKDVFSSDKNEVFMENLKNTLTALRDEKMIMIENGNLMLTDKGLSELFVL